MASYRDIQSQAHFSFSPNNVTAQSSLFCSAALCHLTGNFTIPSPHEIVLLRITELFPVPSAFLERMEISLQKEKIQKDKLNGCTKVQGIVSTADESPLCGQDGTVFSRSPNRNVRSRLILKLTCLLLTNSGLFPFGGPFSWSDGQWYLLPVTC